MAGKRLRVLGGIVVLGCSLAVPQPARAAAVVDQQQPVIDDSVGGLAIGGGPLSDQKLAQVFTVGLAGYLTEVRLPIACDGGDPLILEIQSVAAGLPDGGVLRSQTYDGAGLPSFAPDPPQLRPFTLAVPLPVVAGQQLAIFLYSPLPGACGVFQGPVGDPYPGGDGYFDALPNLPRQWLPLGPPLGDRSDLPFATLVDDRVTVGIDFLPHLRLNRINPRRGGAVEAAVLSSPSFDAGMVDWSTATLGPAGAPALGPGTVADVDRDGDLDLVLEFDARSLGVACGDTAITLLATTVGGVDVRGVDAITVAGCGRP